MKKKTDNYLNNQQSQTPHIKQPIRRKYTATINLTKKKKDVANNQDDRKFLPNEDIEFFVKLPHQETAKLLIKPIIRGAGQMILDCIERIMNTLIKLMSFFIDFD